MSLSCQGKFIFYQEWRIFIIKLFERSSKISFYGKICKELSTYSDWIKFRRKKFLLSVVCEPFQPKYFHKISNLIFNMKRLSKNQFLDHQHLAFLIAITISTLIFKTHFDKRASSPVNNLYPVPLKYYVKVAMYFTVI